MFWALRIKSEIEERFKREIKNGTPLIIRDEWSASGPPHVGSLRGIVIHGLISEVLKGADIANRFLLEINDFDLFDGIPAAFDKELYTQHLGKLLCNVPSPDASAENFGEYFVKAFMAVVNKTSYAPEYYRSSTLYREGKYNDLIKEALDHADVIRRIYKEVSGSEKRPDWLPIQIVCESCGKVGTTQGTAWDGALVTYRCLPNQVTWAQGCGHEGVVSPFSGNAKLPWKVEWPAKFKVLGVNIEGGGKDHNTKGGSRDIARRILAEVFHYPDPVNIPYDFFTIDGKKMSSSKGLGATAAEITELLPTQMVRFLNMKEPKQPIEFDPRGETVPILYDTYDGIAHDFFANGATEWSPAFPYMHPLEKRSALKDAFRPRFSQVAYLVQMPHVDLYQKVSEMKGSALSDEDRGEADERARYAKHWLELYSPEKYKFQIQESLPEAAKTLTSQQKVVLTAIHGYLVSNPDTDGETLHSHIHDIKKQSDLPAAEVFAAIYLSFLGKSSGPQAGWFLTALPREFVLKRLAEASAATA